MKIDGVPTSSIRASVEPGTHISIIDQRSLPHHLVWEDLKSSQDVIVAIKDMHLRGAPLIGAVAAFGFYFAVREAVREKRSHDYLAERVEELRGTRPTAVNLNWALDQQLGATIGAGDLREKATRAWTTAHRIMADDAEQCRQIGLHGLALIERLHNKLNRPINILTHCNAGWLACIDWGTATSPIYQAHHKGIPIHVWVDETRPRNQGSKLTMWELMQEGVPCSLIPDNTGGHLMQHGQVDLVLVGSDRTSRRGDVANKIGTYLKALAAQDNGIPFYVALPSSSFDPQLYDGIKEIPIEMRSPEEVTFVDGRLPNNEIGMVEIAPTGAHAVNYGFDITPNRLVTGLITERGICRAVEPEITKMFPEFATAPTPILDGNPHQDSAPLGT